MKLCQCAFSQLAGLQFRLFSCNAILVGCQWLVLVMIKVLVGPVYNTVAVRPKVASFRLSVMMRTNLPFAKKTADQNKM